MQVRIILFMLMTLLVTVSLVPTVQAEPLPLEQAFPLQVQTKGTNLVLTWRLPAGYYLYPALRLEAVDGALAVLGQQIEGVGTPWPHDPSEHVYRGVVTLTAELAARQSGELRCRLYFRGCAEQGYCYPPSSRLIQVQFNQQQQLLQAQLINDSASSPNTHHATSSLGYMLLSYALAGLLLSLTPCNLPMVPILSSMLVGQEQRSARRGLGYALAYVLGMALSYAGFGVVSSYVGHYVIASLQGIFLTLIMSIILLLLTVSLQRGWHLSWLQNLQERAQQKVMAKRSYGLMRSLWLGMIATIALSPCITPPVVAAMGYIGSYASPLHGGLALFMLGLGMGAPLLLVGASLGHWLPKAGPWLGSMQNIIAMMMLWLLIDLWQPWLPELMLYILRLLWLLGCAWQLWLMPLAGYIAYGVKLTGTLLIVGASYLLWPGDTTTFSVITKPYVLQQQLDQALAARQPVFIMYTATWCQDCRVFRRQVLTHPEVQQALQAYRVIAIDITAQNKDSRTNMGRFKVLAPPSYLLLNEHGQLLQSKTGSLSRQALLTWLKRR